MHIIFQGFCEQEGENTADSVRHHQHAGCRNGLIFLLHVLLENPWFQRQIQINIR
jgi:hypothetical protein